MYEVNIWWHNALSCISQRGNESCRCKTQQPRLDIVDIISLRDDLIAARRCSVAAAQRVDRLCITTSIIDSTPCSDAAWVTSIMLLSLSLSLCPSKNCIHVMSVWCMLDWAGCHMSLQNIIHCDLIARSHFVQKIIIKFIIIIFFVFLLPSVSRIPRGLEKIRRKLSEWPLLRAVLKHKGIV